MRPTGVSVLAAIRRVSGPVGTPRGGRPYGADRSKGQDLERFG
jgi:hypothetical protein